MSRKPMERRNFHAETGSISSTQTSARATNGIADVDAEPFGDGAASRSVDRRTLLLGAAGALAAHRTPGVSVVSARRGDGRQALDAVGA